MIQVFTYSRRKDNNKINKPYYIIEMFSYFVEFHKITRFILNVAVH